MITLIIAGALLILLGILIRYSKCYWLIAGYNTASDEEKKKYDIVGLSKFLGIFLIVLGLLLLNAAFLHYQELTVLFLIVMGLFVALIVYIVIRGQKYYSATGERAKEMKSFSKYIVIGIIAVIVIVGGFLVYNILPPSISVDSEYLRIKGPYGLELPMSEIDAITTNEKMPRIFKRINGFELGNALKGTFDVDFLGKGKIYVTNWSPPYIYIYVNKSYIIVNQKDRKKTEELYKSIKQNWIKAIDKKKKF